MSSRITIELPNQLLKELKETSLFGTCASVSECLRTLIRDKVAAERKSNGGSAKNARQISAENGQNFKHDKNQAGL